MSNQNWRSTLASPEILDALSDAGDRFMRDGCVHRHLDDNGQASEDPSWCDCAENRVTPAEFVEWLQTELRATTGKPIRFERGHRPKSDAPLRAKHLNLALTG